ncbi:MAG: hypothetical protein MUE69_31795 [Myxococcota bacterium]|jgi:hypothetical protein|nr:hypothetical protein [Myxococcota bacterium]
MADDEEEQKKRKAQKTYQGYATPGIDEPPRESDWGDDATVVEPSATDAPRGPDESGELYLPPGSVRSPSIHDSTPLVEVEVVHQHGSAPRMTQPPQTLEIWTQNRIYTLDPQLICVGVADRATNEMDLKHPFVGYRLVGGQHRDGDTFEISYPFPRPGTEAVFEHPKNVRGNFSRTSTVTRVVLRLHVVTVAPNVLVPTWSHITSHELKLPPSKK